MQRFRVEFENSNELVICKHSSLESRSGRTINVEEICSITPVSSTGSVNPRELMSRAMNNYRPNLILSHGRGERRGEIDVEKYWREGGGYYRGNLSLLAGRVTRLTPPGASLSHCLSLCHFAR